MLHYIIISPLTYPNIRLLQATSAHGRRPISVRSNGRNLFFPLSITFAQMTRIESHGDSIEKTTNNIFVRRSVCVYIYIFLYTHTSRICQRTLRETSDFLLLRAIRQRIRGRKLSELLSFFFSRRRRAFRRRSILYLFSSTYPKHLAGLRAITRSTLILFLALRANTRTNGERDATGMSR